MANQAFHNKKHETIPSFLFGPCRCSHDSEASNTIWKFCNAFLPLLVGLSFHHVLCSRLLQARKWKKLLLCAREAGRKRGVNLEWENPIWSSKKVFVESTRSCSRKCRRQAKTRSQSPDDAKSSLGKNQSKSGRKTQTGTHKGETNLEGARHGGNRFHVTRAIVEACRTRGWKPRDEEDGTTVRTMPILCQHELSVSMGKGD